MRILALDISKAKGISFATAHTVENKIERYGTVADVTAIVPEFEAVDLVAWEKPFKGVNVYSFQTLVEVSAVLNHLCKIQSINTMQILGAHWQRRLLGRTSRPRSLSQREWQKHKYRIFRQIADDLIRGEKTDDEVAAVCIAYDVLRKKRADLTLIQCLKKQGL